MSRLFLHCGLCGRKQADGLLSRGHWGHVELPGGGALRACPGCRASYRDWEERLRATAVVQAQDGPRYGSVYR